MRIILVNFQNPDVHDIVFNALEQGSTLLITNVRVMELVNDLVVMDVLCLRRSLYRSQHTVKTLVSCITIHTSHTPVHIAMYVFILWW